MGAFIDAEALIAAERGEVALEEILGPAEQVAIAAVTATVLLEAVDRTTDEALANQRASFVERFLDRVEVVPFDAPAARVRARLEAAFGGNGRGPRALDLAATAMSRGWRIVTRNGDFDGIPGLNVLKI